MSIMLFKDGEKNIYKGVKCEWKICDHRELEHWLGQGYVTSVNDLNKEQSPLEDQEMPMEELRELAKKAGVENWEKAKRKTLLKALEDDKKD